jgi:hypothetical protein
MRPALRCIRVRMRRRGLLCAEEFDDAPISLLRKPRFLGGAWFCGKTRRRPVDRPTAWTAADPVECCRMGLPQSQ